MGIYVFTIIFLFIIRLRFPKGKSIAEIIRSRYGNHILKCIRKYEKVDFKIRKISLDVSFLEGCLANNVVPSFLKYKMSNIKLMKTPTYKESQMKYIQDEIKSKQNNLNHANIELLRIHGDLQKHLSYFDLRHVVNLSVTANISAIRKIEYTQNYKLLELIGKDSHHDPADVIKNFSSYQLSDIEQKLLTRGLNFALPPKKVKYCDYLLPFEMLYRNIMNERILPETLIHLKSRVRDIGLSSFRLYNKTDHRFENISKEEYDAFISLTANNSIIIQKADKGNTIVIVDKVIYVQKMEELLGDTSKFAKITFDSKYKMNQELRYLLDMETAINSCLDSLHNSKHLPDADYNYLKPVGSNPGILYGCCKVHKPVAGQSPPFRPILSAIGTASYKIAKFFVPILKPFCVNNHTLKDSFSFADDIVKQDSSLFMASFDVDSLFTNIPLDETINLCIERLFEQNHKIKGLNKKQCKDLLLLATKQSCFVFNGTYYKQLDGVAMGSPLGPTLANIFLCHHEDIWLTKCPNEFKPVYFKRYVDDIIVLFKSKDHVKKFHRFLNSRHPNMSFTYETEDHNKMAFLDVQITRHQNEFSTSIYRKPTFSGVYSNFKSHLPVEYKRGLLLTLLYRAFTISSSYLDFHDETYRLKEIWQKNGFPLFFIDKCIHLFLDKLFTSKSKENSVKTKKEVQISLTYLGSTSLQVRKRLRNIFRSCLPDVSLKIVFGSDKRLRNSFSFKDKLPIDLQSLVVYKYTCSTCNGTYIGKTKRHFLVRTCEHLQLSYKTGKKYTFRDSTATTVAKHAHHNHHVTTIEDFEIVSKAGNDYHLKIKESLLINKENPSLNISSDSIPLYLFNK